VRDRNLAGCTVDERDSQLILESPDLLGEGRLGDVLTRGRAGEVALFRERKQIFQLPKLHKKSL
jgi:hypothetical protein